MADAKNKGGRGKKVAVKLCYGCGEMLPEVSSDGVRIVSASQWRGDQATRRCIQCIANKIPAQAADQLPAQQGRASLTSEPLPSSPSSFKNPTFRNFFSVNTAGGVAGSEMPRGPSIEAGGEPGPPSPCGAARPAAC